MKIASLMTDAKLEAEGREFSMGDGGFVTVARMGNPAYKTLYRKLIRPYKQQVKDEVLGDEVANSVYIAVLAQTVLLNWRGIKDVLGGEGDGVVDHRHGVSRPGDWFRQRLSQLSVGEPH